MPLPTNHQDNVGEHISAAIVNNIATQVNTNTDAIAAGVTPADGSVTTTKLAAGAATGAALGTDVAKLVAGKVSPASQIQQVLSVNDLTDAQFTTLAAASGV